jgi:hypothetical protein
LSEIVAERELLTATSMNNKIKLILVTFLLIAQASASATPTYAERTIFYNYNSIWSKLASTASKFPNPKIDRSTEYSGNCQLTYTSELFFSYLSPNTDLGSKELSPFEPIIFVNNSSLDMLADWGKEEMFMAPAIVLRYADDKAWNQTAGDVTMATIDAISLATGYGELKAGVTGLRKAWTLFDMANSTLNLTLNITLATENAKVKELLGYYNLVTGGITIVRTASGVKNLYSAIKGRQLLKGDDITKFLKAAEDGGEDVLKNFPADDLDKIEAVVAKVKTDANARGLTTLEQQAERVLEKIRKVRLVSIESSLAGKLTGSIKSTYEDLIKGGLKPLAGENTSIRLLSPNGEEVALIVNNKLMPTKWCMHKDVYTKIETSEGYWLVKDGNDIVGIDLGFKEGRILDGSEVNAYWKQGRKGYEPYKSGSKVIERSLKPGEKLYIVEYAGQSQPGAFASKNKILTVSELRKELAVIKPWKDEDAGFLVVREYEVTNRLRVRDGLIGPQVEEIGIFKGQTFEGGGHQFEFLEGKWDQFNSFEDFMMYKDTYQLK